MRVLLVGTLAYVGLVVLQRVSGKRTLSKLNAFDLIVTVAMGSALATTFLSSDVGLAEGITTFAVLVALQFAVTFMSVRLPVFKRLVKATPRRLVHQGVLLEQAMRDERVTEEEVLQAARATGHASLEGVDVVLETNGTLSVMRIGESPSDALRNVQ